jgi:hypothetical protein
MYQVTITIEPTSPLFHGRKQPHYVARDKDGHWRTYGLVDPERDLTPQEITEYLFHKCEIGRIEVIDGKITVEILE